MIYLIDLKKVIKSEMTSAEVAKIVVSEINKNINIPATVRVDNKDNTHIHLDLTKPELKIVN